MILKRKIVKQDEVTTLVPYASLDMTSLSPHHLASPGVTPIISGMDEA